MFISKKENKLQIKFLKDKVADSEKVIDNISKKMQEILGGFLFS